MRPKSLDDFVGQEHILGPERVFRRALQSDTLPSMILWGPPGSGKTTLAEVVAGVTRSRFVRLSAVSAGVADLRREVEAARKLREFTNERTVLFIDEIHRFNKAQQDAILPHVESGIVTLIGATTENPSFEVNASLLSRCRVFPLKRLSDDDIEGLVRRAIGDDREGLGEYAVSIDDDTTQCLARMASGDARVALTALEMAVEAAAPGQDGVRTISAEAIQDVMQRPTLLYDKTGDMHYHLISAFIKSIRGSDPDAAVYWLARMLEAGEDPIFVTRRMMISAAEDIGLADPQALLVATACHTAVHAIGMPEAYLPLTECALYLALSPKSNSTITTYHRAADAVREHLDEPVPLHLRNAVTPLNKAMGFGKDYRYSHDYDEHYVTQTYLPVQMASEHFYEAGGTGAEADMFQRLQELKSKCE